VGSRAPPLAFISPNQTHGRKHIIKVRITIAAALTSLLVVASARAASPSHRCSFVAFAPQSSNLAFAISARNTGCATARSVARRSGPQRDRPGWDPANPVIVRYSAFGFGCFGNEVFPAGMGYVAFRCYRGNAVVRFNRS